MSSSASRIWLVRHGETEWSRSGQHTGRSDVSLTDAGKREAAQLSERLAGRPFALVLASPLVRAWETCRLAGYASIAEPCDDLMEWDYGHFEGRTRAEIQAELPGWTIWNGDVPGGETLGDVRVRAMNVLERASSAGGDVLLFGHGHALRVLGATWMDLPPRHGAALVLGTASISVLGHENGDRAILAWNVTMPICSS